MQAHLLDELTGKQGVMKWLESALISYKSSSSKWQLADEDVLCQDFLKSLSGQSIVTQSGALAFDSYKIRGRGPNAPEKRTGTDGICVVRILTTLHDLVGFFLFQAKKIGSFQEPMDRVVSQSQVMMKITAASQIIMLSPLNVYISGAMNAISYRNAKPSVEDIPAVKFSQFVVEVLLRGLMLAPLNADTSSVLSALNNDACNVAGKTIDYILGIIAAEPASLEQARMDVNHELSSLGFEFDKLLPNLHLPPTSQREGKKSDGSSRGR